MLSLLQTQKVFGNKWNDIAAYLPMRCNNDIKNYFNLYLKDKTNVFSENCYLRSGYDLHQLLQSEPDEVMQRRQRLEAEKVRPQVEMQQLTAGLKLPSCMAVCKLAAAMGGPRQWQQ